MVKAPSRHSMDRKFRPWRKGKSARANKQGSLKHQLRGQERLLSKLERQKDNDSRMDELRVSIAHLKTQIAEKELQQQQRENAKRSHGTRFLERKRLTRLERTARNSNDQKDLLRIAMDQIYVAHYPLEKTYRPLFRNGKRWLHHSVSRAQLRDSILQDLKKGKIQPAKWIPKDQYDRIPGEWTVQNEVELFQYPSGKKDKDNTQTKDKQDDRFAMQSNHEVILQAAQDLESKLAKEENAIVAKKEGAEASDSDSDSDSVEEDVKPKAQEQSATKEKASGDSSDIATDSDSSSSSSSESEQEGEKKPAAARKKSQKESPLLRENKIRKDTAYDEEQIDSDKDEFFIPAKEEEDVSVFDRIIKDNQDHILPAENPAKGDKSQGWATQQQRPGKYKKTRTRQ